MLFSDGSATFMTNNKKIYQYLQYKWQINRQLPSKSYAGDQYC